VINIIRSRCGVSAIRSARRVMLPLTYLLSDMTPYPLYLSRMVSIAFSVGHGW